MMNKEPNGADMILQLLGKGECFSNQSADPLPDGAIKALDITGFGPVSLPTGRCRLLGMTV